MGPSNDRGGPARATGSPGSCGSSGSTGASPGWCSIRLALAAVALPLLGLASCGGDGGPDDYSAEHRAEFVDDCSTSAASAETCGCFYDRLAEEVPFDRFRQFDEALADPTATLPPDLAQLAAGCAAAEQGRTDDGG